MLTRVLEIGEDLRMPRAFDFPVFDADKEYFRIGNPETWSFNCENRIFTTPITCSSARTTRTRKVWRSRAATSITSRRVSPSRVLPRSWAATWRD